MKRVDIYFLISAIVLIVISACSKKEDSVAPVANFTLVENEVMVGDVVEVQNKSENAEYYSWDFGDGSIYPDENPQHYYNKSGTYSITLRAINKGLEDTYAESIIVKEPPVGTITVTTKSITNITTTSANSGGIIFSNSSKEIITKGICWHRTNNPTLESNRGSTNDGRGSENYSSMMGGLEPSTIYYVKAYVQTVDEIIYGKPVSFKTKDDVPSYEPNNVNIDFTNSEIVIDGAIDNAWNMFPEHQIERVNIDQTVSLGSGARYKAAWNDQYIYLLIIVPDDNYYSYLEANVNSWEADRVEIFFDVNASLKDGNGVEETGTGHYQATMDDTNPIYSGGDENLKDLNQFSLLVENDGYYVLEYAISFEALIDEQGIQLNPYERRRIGFDIKIADLDEPGKGANEAFGAVNWSNNINENWFNMDDAGILNFVGGGK